MHAYMPQSWGVVLHVPVPQVFGMKLLLEHCATPPLQALLQQVPLTQCPLLHCTLSEQPIPSARLAWQVAPLQNAVPMQLPLVHGAPPGQLQLPLHRVAPQVNWPHPVAVIVQVPAVGVSQR